MVRLVAQYLEDEPALEGLAPAAAAERLRRALAIVPISDVALGWGLPAPVVDAVREVTIDAGARLHAWHLLLAGSRLVSPPEAWRVIGLDGRPVPAYRNMREFTFVCPNHPEARAAALRAVSELAADERYDGVMLDRMRFPSPFADPERLLACFCGHCRFAAARVGLDLDEAREALSRTLAAPEGARHLLSLLLGGTSDGDQVVTSFLAFREVSVTALIAEAAEVARGSGKEIALDCFSPSLTKAVGQELGGLGRIADDVKLMTYGGTFAPAGLPFELHGAAAWLARRSALAEAEAIGEVAAASGLPLPASLSVLERDGLPAAAMAIEAARARASGLERFAAGVDLVELDGVTCTGWNDERVTETLIGVREAGIAGLVLSWDLRHIADRRLRMVAGCFGADLRPPRRRMAFDGSAA